MKLLLARGLTSKKRIYMELVMFTDEQRDSTSTVIIKRLSNSIITLLALWITRLFFIVSSTGRYNSSKLRLVPDHLQFICTFYSLDQGTEVSLL